MEAIKDYTVHIDEKKRITLRGASYEYYNVQEFENGCILLEPRELTVPDMVSKKSLNDMKKTVEGFKETNSLDPLDTLQLIIDSKSDEEKELYASITNLLLRKKQKNVIKRNLF